MKEKENMECKFLINKAESLKYPSPTATPWENRQTATIRGLKARYTNMTFKK